MGSQVPAIGTTPGNQQVRLRLLRCVAQHLRHVTTLSGDLTSFPALLVTSDHTQAMLGTDSHWTHDGLIGPPKTRVITLAETLVVSLHIVTEDRIGHFSADAARRVARLLRS